MAAAFREDSAGGGEVLWALEHRKAKHQASFQVMLHARVLLSDVLAFCVYSLSQTLRGCSQHSGSHSLQVPLQHLSFEEFSLPAFANKACHQLPAG